MLLVLLIALCPPAPLKSLTFWRYTNQIIIIIIIKRHLTTYNAELVDGKNWHASQCQLLVIMCMTL